MKIALVNYRYFISGGPERYYFNIKEVLERNGHEVMPFSIKNSRNLPSEYDKYFLDGVDDEVYYAQSKKTLGKIFKSFGRMFYSFEAKSKFKDFLKATHPDVVYIMQYHNKISPSIIAAAREENIPVVHRISDFQYMCPNALFYNDAVGVCEDCLHGHRFSCVKYKCVQGSAVLSAVKAMAKFLHDKMGITRRIERFVVPSSFTLSKLAEYGIPQEKLVHIPTFFNLKEENPQVSYEPYVLYVGRIERQKGLMTLIKAFAGTKMKLKVVGFSNNGYIDELKSYLADKEHKIEFLGKLDFNDIVPFLKSCRCTVVPSEWYDNFPNAILESFAFKKCVIATDFGSLPELVENGQTGLTFKYGDADDLRSIVELMLSDETSAREMGENAFARILDTYSPDAHYHRLMEVLQAAVDGK
ncbi:MAG: glycosyltransferase family 4 protein [Muribaculaceae bacterium]